jgi:HK97 family phage major capsid protein
MISKLKDGEGRYLWQQGLAAGQPDTILNLPVNESEYAPSTFTTGKYVGILGNFQFYWIAELFGMEIQRLNELFAATSQVGFIGRMWADGAPVLEEAFARVKLA